MKNRANPKTGGAAVVDLKSCNDTSTPDTLLRQRSGQRRHFADMATRAAFRKWWHPPEWDGFQDRTPGEIEAIRAGRWAP